MNFTIYIKILECFYKEIGTNTFAVGGFLLLGKSQWCRGGGLGGSEPPSFDLIGAQLPPSL